MKQVNNKTASKYEMAGGGVGAILGLAREELDSVKWAGIRQKWCEDLVSCRAVTYQKLGTFRTYSGLQILLLGFGHTSLS